MQSYTLDPLTDPRWDALVASYPRASVFHTGGFLRALSKTYGYRPLALTSTTADKRLSDGVVFCEVRSWITGARLVSLPFADHAEPLLNGVGDPLELRQWMEAACSRDRWRYIEFRPVSWQAQADSTLVASQSFWYHTLDLAPSLQTLFRNLHKSCIQRRIRHAEHENLTYERGRTEELLSEFYKLLLMTKRRHRLLPQPRKWFQNLLVEMRPDAEIRLARKDDVPVAAILTLRHRGTMVYKYGCSDERFHHLAGMPYLFWQLIEESKSEGIERIDFGRTDLDNAGLIEFKDRLGTIRSKMTYLRYPQSQTRSFVDASHLPPGRSLFSLLPDAISSSAGQLAYRHFA
jgi:CelD/BcsL family acetyltransferase involved in cellulose biosynthesis